MAKKIFKSIILVSFAVLLTSIVLIMGVMYGYFTRISEGQLKTELEIASQGVAAGGTDYLAQFFQRLDNFFRDPRGKQRREYYRDNNRNRYRLNYAHSQRKRGHI